MVTVKVMVKKNIYSNLEYSEVLFLAAAKSLQRSKNIVVVQNRSAAG